MKKFNIFENKTDSILALLLNVDRRANHDLYLCSCYFNNYSVIKLIKNIKDKIKIKKAFLYVDRRNALITGADALKSLERLAKNEGVNLEIYIVSEKNVLFHTKAYGLISNNDNKYSGSLVIGSANLTKLGITNNTKGLGNIESILGTNDGNDLKDFLDRTNSLHCIKKEDLDKFESSESFEFKLAVLRQGYFVHRWSDNLNQLFAVRYKLNENGRNNIANKNSEIRAMKFDVDSASISKNYFNFDFTPRDDVHVKQLIKNFGIETYLGHWVPKSVFEEFSEGSVENRRFMEFVNRLRSEWENQKQKIESGIRGDYGRLQELNFLDIPDPQNKKGEFDPYKSLLRRVEGTPFGGMKTNAGYFSDDDDTEGIIKNIKKLGSVTNLC